MEYVISILVLAAVITAWGLFYSKWKAARGGCGSCSAMMNGGKSSSCGKLQDNQGDDDPSGCS